MAEPESDGSSPRPGGTVGIYDRPAGADRRATIVKVVVAAVAVAGAVASYWLFYGY
jgi:hypothetical protein